MISEATEACIIALLNNIQRLVEVEGNGNLKERLNIARVTHLHDELLQTLGNQTPEKSIVQANHTRLWEYNLRGEYAKNTIRLIFDSAFPLGLGFESKTLLKAYARARAKYANALNLGLLDYKTGKMCPTMSRETQTKLNDLQNTQMQTDAISFSTTRLREAMDQLATQLAYTEFAVESKFKGF